MLYFYTFISKSQDWYHVYAPPPPPCCCRCCCRFVRFLIIWNAFLIQHLKCSCTSITLTVSPIINNLLGTESAGINGFGPERFWLFYVSKEVWFTSGFVRVGNMPSALPETRNRLWIRTILQQKDYFLLISVKVALRYMYVPVLLRLDENYCICGQARSLARPRVFSTAASFK